jgi:hypothetical protein
MYDFLKIKVIMDVSTNMVSISTLITDLFHSS